MDIGNQIKNARKKIGFTQEELALQIGVTAQAVSRWESGAGLPDITMVVPLAQALSVTTDALFGLAERSNENEQYVELQNKLDAIVAQYCDPNENALKRCEFLREELQKNPTSYLIMCLLAEQTANLSRYVDFNDYAKEVWPTIRETAIRYGVQLIRYCDNREWKERTHFALAWIYIHERDMGSAKEHIHMLPSVANNRLQESILAQVASFEHGVEAMKATVQKNLQNFTRALNKEILYAAEDMSWNDDPKSAVKFGEWGIRLIHTLSENEDMISYCRGFTRDLYQYIMNADLRMDDYLGAAGHFRELEAEMQRHYDHYQKVLANPLERAKYDERVLRNMTGYTAEFIAQKKERLLGFLRHVHGEEKFAKLQQALAKQAG